MKHSAPPSIATWMLEHWMPGGCNDCLAGDLLEEFHAGRTSGWYWRQVFAAITIKSSREILAHRTVLIFAVLWSMLVLPWLLAVAAIEKHFNFGARIEQMDFPWSIACEVGLTLAANLIFVWVGILAYLIPHLWMRRNLKLRLLAQGIAASVPVLIALSAALIFLPQQFLRTQAASRLATPVPANVPQHPRTARFEHALHDWTEATQNRVRRTDRYGDARHAITDLSKGSLLMRLPFLLCMLSTLWGVSSRFRRSTERMTV